MRLKTKATTLGLMLSVLGAGCLSDPELPTCADFELGSLEECGTPCETYCEFMVESCGDVYASSAACINDCANEPVSDFVNGEPGDRTGNSLSCRLTYGLEGDCTEASLRNSTQCVGATCDDYCGLMMTNCEGAYPTLDYCLSVCAELPRGELGVDANTVECRFGYAERAATDPLACDAASMGGGRVCGDACEIYCDFHDLNCTGANALYADRQTCITVCEYMDDEGSYDDWDFDLELDTVQCRLYHVGPPAELQPGTHCPHAGVYNAQHCGIDPALSSQPEGWPCPTYCDLVLFNCPGVYADETECMDACEDFEEVREADPALGPGIFPASTVQCPTM